MTTDSTFTRRGFLTQTAQGFGAIALYGMLGGCEHILQQIASRPIRRDISCLSPNDPIIQTYKDAVQAMKSLPSSDPRNWVKQAQIHYNHCPHGNWYFLPWHRAYLFYFEEICRKLTGNKDFALPYWNWSTTRHIPAPFWGSGNPLYDSNRTATQASSAADEFVGASVINSILAETNFFVFGSDQASAQRQFTGAGRLEGTPHNYIHNFVGGDMGTFMSPLDAVFWCHHNMVDYLWKRWNLDLKHSNTNDPAWTQFKFSGNFVNGDGNSVDITPIVTVLMPLLSYRFDDGCGPALTAVNEKALRTFLEKGANVQLNFLQRFHTVQGLETRVGRPAVQAITIRPESLRTVLASQSRNRMLLTIGNITQPPSESVFARVFVNKRDATEHTPITDPHYAGSFAFFHESSGPMRNMKANFMVDVTDTVRRLHNLGILQETQQLEISIVAVPLPAPPRLQVQRVNQFSLQRLEIGIVQPPTVPQ